MKILHIIPSLEIGGAERLTYNICCELNSRDGVEVNLVIFRDVNRFGEEDFIKHVPADVKLSLTGKNTYSVAKLQEAIDSFQPDIIHSHLFEAEIVSRFCHYPQAKWFSHFHDNMPQLANWSWISKPSKQLLTNAFEKYTLYKRYKTNGGNNFIAISKDAEEYAAKVIPRSSRLYYLKNAIDFDLFYHPVKKIDTTKLIQLINVGSFQAKKNQQFLIDVIKYLNKEEERFHLRFLGDGKERNAVEQKAANLGVSKEVSFEGNITEVQNFVQGADIYLHSAYYEPFGLVILEAMAAGLPVVSLNGGGNADITEHGKNGYIFDNQEVELVAKQVTELVNNPELYQKIASAGQQTARQYGIQQYCDQLIKRYQQTLV